MIVENIDEHRAEAKLLRDTLKGLRAAGGMTEQEHETEKVNLAAIIQRYQQLLPAVEISTSRSSIVVQCHEYKEAVERQMQWLTETEEKVREDMPHDDLELVKVMLEEQEVTCYLFLYYKLIIHNYLVNFLSRMYFYIYYYQIFFFIFKGHYLFNYANL